MTTPESSPYGSSVQTVAPWRHWLRPWVLKAEALTFPWIKHPKLRGRSQLADLLRARRLLGIGIEIGVWEGTFSEYILAHWPGEKLIAVDPWIYWENGYPDISNVKQSEMDARFELTRKKLSTFGNRAEIWRMLGDEAAAMTPDSTLDFVYLDAQHHESAVSHDLHTWYPKLRSGALFAGHDYLDGELASGSFGVKTAVDNFAREKRLEVGVTQSEAWPTWYLFKP